MKSFITYKKTCFLFTYKIIYTYFARRGRFLYINITHVYNLLFLINGTDHMMNGKERIRERDRENGVFRQMAEVPNIFIPISCLISSVCVRHSSIIIETM